MSGLQGGVRISWTPISYIVFFAFKEFWLGCQSCQSSFHLGLLLSWRVLSKYSLTKSAKNCPVKYFSYCSYKTVPLPWTMATKLSLFYIQRPLFSLFIAFQWQTPWFLCHAIAVVDLAISHELVLWFLETPSKKFPIPLVQKSLQRECFTFLAKSDRVLPSCLDIKFFIRDLNSSNCYVVGSVWLYLLIYDHLP